jgi:drug/metabolite transporter (DMT)-like permease
MMSRSDTAGAQPEVLEKDDGDLTDLLAELRVLLPGAQTLTAFLIILPFNEGFDQVRSEEKAVYLVTFLCSVLSLVLFTAPAAHHRLQRPLRDREGFKTMATRLVVAGLVPLSIAIILATQFVVSEVVPYRLLSWSISGIVAVVILILWWIVPMRRHERLSGEQEMHR